MSALQLSSGPPDPRLFVLTDEAQGVCCLFLGTRLASPGLRRSSSSYPKTGEDGYLLRSRLSLASVFLPSCLRAPSATGPKVVSPTVAPRSLGPIFGRGTASTPWAPSASRSATFGLGTATVAGEAQSVFTCKKAALLSRKQIFHVHNR